MSRATGQLRGGRRGLGVRWSKTENDLVVYGRNASPNYHWLAQMFGKEFIKELEARGFDPKSFRLQVLSKDQSGLEEPTRSL